MTHSDWDHCHSDTFLFHRKTFIITLGNGEYVLRLTA